MIQIHREKDTVNIPLMSTVKLPYSQLAISRYNYRMQTKEEKREVLVKYIRDSLEELDISMEAFDALANCKKDTIRNFLRGKTRDWRSDNKEKIIGTFERELAKKRGKLSLSPSQPSSSLRLNNIECAIINALYAILIALTADNTILRDNLHDILNDQLEKYHDADLADVEKILRFLLAALEDKKPSMPLELLSQMLRLAPAGSA